MQFVFLNQTDHLVEQNQPRTRERLLVRSKVHNKIQLYITILGAVIFYKVLTVRKYLDILIFHMIDKWYSIIVNSVFCYEIYIFSFFSLLTIKIRH